MKQGKIIIISGPSQVGKDAIIKQLLKHKDLNLVRTINYTTRRKRPEERNGLDHKFVSPEKFRKLVKEGFFLEWAPVRNRMYGTPKKQVSELLKKGKNVILKIDVRGKDNILKYFPKATTIFILPDSLEILKKRMEKKGFSGEQMRVRWKETLNEMRASGEYQYQVLNYNNQLAKAVEDVLKILKKTLT